MPISAASSSPARGRIGQAPARVKAIAIPSEGTASASRTSLLVRQLADWFGLATIIRRDAVRVLVTKAKYRILFATILDNF